MPRLETICGCVYEIDKIMNRKSILSGFLSFSTIPYNYNHYILSEFLRNGAIILTTNFDLGIENAYSNKYNDFTNIFIDETSVFKTSHGGMVYHLHGSTNNSIEQLGATIARVKNGLNNNIKEHLINKINNSKKMIFLGYGAVDSFDITPLLESKKISGENLIFVQHQENENSSCNKKEVKFPYYLNRITKRFAHVELLACNTTMFLKNLANKNLIDISDQEKSRICFNWEKEFLHAMGGEYTDDEKLLNYLGIRYQLGFNPRIVEKEIPKIVNNIKKLRSKITTNSPRIMDYFNMALRDFETPKNKQFILPAKRVSQAVNFIDKSQIIALRDECDYYLDKYRNTQIEICKDDNLRINFLLGLLCTYSEFAYDKVQYISYIITCLKYRALFSARFKKENPLDINNKELLLSLEISHFEGVVTALLHSIESTIIYKEITEDDNKLQIEKLIYTAKSISSIIGCNYYKKIIDNILNL